MRPVPAAALALALAAAACSSTPPDSPPPALPAPSEPGGVAAAPAVPATPAAPGTPAAPAAPVLPAAPALPAPPEVATGNRPGLRIPPFLVPVHRIAEGESRVDTLDSRAAGGPVLYVAVSARCGYCNEDAPLLRRVEDAFLPKGLAVVYLYPSREEPDAEKRAWHAAKGLRGGLVLDADAAVARSLGVDKTPTAFLADRDGILVYRGAVALPPMDGGEKEPFLARAVEEHLSGRPVTAPLTEPLG